MIGAVIFDLDGTLYDKSRLPLFLIVNQLFGGHIARLGRERAARKKLKGRSFPSETACYDCLFGLIDGGRGEREKIASWYEKDYKEATLKVLSRHCKPFSWVGETLSEWKAQGVKLAVLSDYGWVEEKLQALGIDPALFDAVSSAPALGGMKPCPEVFLSLARNLDVDPAACLVVGDREDTDGAGALSAGMQFCLVSGGTRPLLHSRD